MCGTEKPKYLYGYKDKAELSSYPREEQRRKNFRS